MYFFVCKFNQSSNSLKYSTFRLQLYFLFEKHCEAHMQGMWLTIPRVNNSFHDALLLFFLFFPGRICFKGHVVWPLFSTQPGQSGVFVAFVSSWNEKQIPHGDFAISQPKSNVQFSFFFVLLSKNKGFLTKSKAQNCSILSKNHFTTKHSS